jgi:multiple antibiotic resistance protein
LKQNSAELERRQLSGKNLWIAITGLGAITVAMLLSSKAPSKLSYGILLLSILLVLIVVYFSFIYGEKTAKKIGQTGMLIIQRIMGLIIMVIAVQFVINSTESVLSRIF